MHQIFIYLFVCFVKMHIMNDKLHMQHTRDTFLTHFLLYTKHDTCDMSFLTSVITNIG